MYPQWTSKSARTATDVFGLSKQANASPDTPKLKGPVKGLSPNGYGKAFCLPSEYSHILPASLHAMLHCLHISTDTICFTQPFCGSGPNGYRSVKAVGTLRRCDLPMFP